MFKPTVLLVCLSGLLAAQSPAPERTVQGSALLSQRDPRIRIQLPASAKYVGADRWPLYHIADCELHAFVRADSREVVHELYWIQFEGYLPSKPEMHHTYDSPRHTQIGGLDFYVDTWVRADGEKTDPGSDRQHIESLIHTKGYKMPAGMVYVRLVHLLDVEKRRELMIIYGEELPEGITAADLGERGKAHDQLPALEAAAVEHAKEKVRIDPLQS